MSKIPKLTTFFQKQPSDTDTPEPPFHFPTADELSVELEGNNISNEAEVNSPQSMTRMTLQRLNILKKQNQRYTTEQKSKIKIQQQQQCQKM